MANNNNKHKKVYIDQWGLGDQVQMLCEIDGCNNWAVDIHHIVKRSKFGKNKKHLQDDFNNLIGLCRICHNKAESYELSQDYIISQKKYPIGYVKHQITNPLDLLKEKTQEEGNESELV